MPVDGFIWLTPVRSNFISDKNQFLTIFRDAIYKSALDLYDYFTYTKVQSLGIPLLIVANKQDAAGAVDAEALEKNLKREM